jgi:carbon-monoxide dehydrogenase medium subunit
VKPAPFGYSRPSSVDEALDILAEHGAHAKVLAGGQSLLPLLSMRLAAPGHLVDINRLASLSYVQCDADGVRVGALTRHAELERDEQASRTQPLLRQALRLVAHPTIRNRGTTVGSIVHADPAGEMTAVLALLGGSVRVAEAGATRDVAAADFFLGPLESDVQAGQLALEAFFPALPERAGTAFVEVSRRQGDYALCGVAAIVQLDDAGLIESARLAFIAMSSTPLVLDLSDLARGAAPDDSLPAVREAVLAAVEPEADIHATAAYRRQLAGVLAVRALRQAAARAAAPLVAA